MQEAEFNLIVGSPGAGKSTFTAGYVKRYNQSALVYKHLANIDDKAFSFLSTKTKESWRQGAAPGQPVKCKIAGRQEDYAEFLRWIMAGGLRNGLLVVDDATIFERDRLTKEMNELVTMRRHYGLSIWLIYHGLSLLPIEQFVFANRIVLFNTTDNLKYKAAKMPRFEALTEGVTKARANFQSTDPRRKFAPVVVKLA